MRASWRGSRHRPADGRREIVPGRARAEPSGIVVPRELRMLTKPGARNSRIATRALRSQPRQRVARAPSGVSPAERCSNAVRRKRGPARLDRRLARPRRCPRSTPRPGTRASVQECAGRDVVQRALRRSRRAPHDRHEHLVHAGPLMAFDHIRARERRRAEGHRNGAASGLRGQRDERIGIHQPIAVPGASCVPGCTGDRRSVVMRIRAALPPVPW